MPGKGETIRFQNYHKQLQAPFVIYADFEAITEKVSRCKHLRSTPIVHTPTKLFVVITTGTQNLFNHFVVKTRSTIFWKNVA